jgi:hypothetical protein
VTGYRDPFLISVIVTPGRDAYSRAAADQYRPTSDGDYLSRTDPEHYVDLVSDSQGRITFPALIPGATYRVVDMTSRDDPRGRQVRREFVAAAGEAVELGDVLIEKPES